MDNPDTDISSPSQCPWKKRTFMNVIFSPSISWQQPRKDFDHCCQEGPYIILFYQKTRIGSQSLRKIVSELNQQQRRVIVWTQVYGSRAAWEDYFYMWTAKEAMKR
jgi:hypothetical protein